jgi:nucleoside-diphosphate-sugar epimerase
MKCFVTGAAGYIGSSLVHRLINEGHEVTGLLHHKTPIFAEKKAHYVTGDITIENTYIAALKDIEVIFHCAAYVKDYGSYTYFKKINFEGTQKIASLSLKLNISRFINLGHIQHETNQYDFYNETKKQAEYFLQDLYKKEGFPFIGIRPGNVYGPGPTTWVIRPLKAIQKNRIALIDHGAGIFHHTYIDNLLDALILAMRTSGIEGKCIDVTDGDSTINWRRYFNDLAEIIGKAPISKNITKNQALFISKFMYLNYLLLRREPWITTPAVYIFSNQKEISIDAAHNLLNYHPNINYQTAINNIKKWIIENEPWDKVL